jgi:hypothetical protein
LLPFSHLLFDLSVNPVGNNRAGGVGHFVASHAVALFDSKFKQEKGEREPTCFFLASLLPFSRSPVWSFQ